MPALATDCADRSSAEVVGLLETQFGDRVQTGETLCEQHGHTLTWVANEPPDAVFYPTCTDDVVAVVKLCATHGVPIIPFGAGTSLEGHLNAPQGGISLDFSRMNQILAVNMEDLDCVVEAGVTRKQLNAHLRDTGLFFAVDPGADATVGGMAATRASGTNAVRYGTMRENIVNLTVVTGEGEVVRTAHRARKSSAGYDLTHLMVGSEGTLGIITEATVKLHGIPESILVAVCPFTSIEGACNATIMAIQMGLIPARIELLDAVQVKACNAHSNLTLAEEPTLFLEFHGTEASAREQVETFKEIAAEEGGGAFHWAEHAEERNALWAGRHDAYWAARDLLPGGHAIVTDVCVPISRLAECVTATHEDIRKHRLIAPIVGHVGDGNFHVQVQIPQDDSDALKIVEGFLDRLVERALSMDGTCTGEHGVGTGKMKYLRAEHGHGLELMAAIKRSLDPSNILNPGKIVLIS